MPPKVKLMKTQILDSAVDIVRKEGAGALNARSLAAYLSCSTQPIFSNFASMDELKSAVKSVSYTEYLNFNEREISSGEYPPYKAVGMAYIRFAKEEPELFKLLFMCDRGEGESSWDDFTDNKVIPIIMKNLEITKKEAEIFQLEMWSFVHGIATMFVTGYFTPEKELVSKMLTDAYMGLSRIYKERKEMK